MCRLLGYVTSSPTPVADSLGPALFEEYTALARMHGDGWGMAWSDGETVDSTSAATSAITDQRYGELASTALGTAGLVHLRWATEGIAIQPENAHPFADGNLAFAHNGYVNPVSTLEALLGDDSRSRLRGTTDSERYFQYVRQHITELGAHHGVRRAVGLLHKAFPACSLNALLLTPTTLYAIHANAEATGPIDEVLRAHSENGVPRGHGSHEEYFEMAYRVGPDSVHVVSSGVTPHGWEPVPADSILEIDVATRALSIHPIGG